MPQELLLLQMAQIGHEQALVRTGHQIQPPVGRLRHYIGELGNVPVDKICKRHIRFRYSQKGVEIGSPQICVDHSDLSPVSRNEQT